MVTTALVCMLLLQGQAPSQAASAQGPVATLGKVEQQHQKDLDGDIATGKKATTEVEKSEKLSDNKEYVERVNRIGQELAKIAQTTPVDVYWGDKHLNRFDYTFKVIKGKDVNAFTLP